MGECGCGDGFGDLILAGPEGQIYTLRFACACDYCDTPVAILVDWHSAKGKGEMLDGLEIPEFTVPRTFEDLGCTAIPMVDPLTLAKYLFRLGILADSEGSDPEDYLTEVRDALNEAAAETWQKWLNSWRSYPT